MGDERITLFLCGDVMTGRGIDQVLPHPCDPTLHEDYIVDARDYVALAEERSGPIPAPVGPEYIWGEALGELARVRPDARIINLETSITCRDAYWPGKGIHYRMSPANAACLSAAGIDVCCLANNHVADWGFDGLAETLATLERLEIGHTGAGRDADEAAAPAVVDLGARGRVLVFAFGAPSSGVPTAWAAGRGALGVNLLPDLSAASLERVREAVERWRRPGDVVVVSVHWGPNWGYAITAEERRFCRALVDEVGVAVVHGHSSHHVKGIEVYRDRLILHGCGDLLTDYEGIHGYEDYRGDLGLLYVPVLERDGRLERLDLVPTRVERFRLVRPTPAEVGWLRDVLCREGAPLGTGAEAGPDGRLRLWWAPR